MWRESGPCRPINAYGRSKLEAEAVVAQRWPNHAILRSSIIYGPDPPLRSLGRTLFLQFVVRIPYHCPRAGCLQPHMMRSSRESTCFCAYGTDATATHALSTAAAHQQHLPNRHRCLNGHPDRVTACFRCPFRFH